MNEIYKSEEYSKFLSQVKKQIQTSRVKAVLSLNAHMLYTYWFIGKGILEGLEKNAWGTKVMEKISKDLKNSFPDQKGFSIRNLKYMKIFAEEYNEEILQQFAKKLQSSENECIIIGQQSAAQFEEFFIQSPISQIPWFHHCLLLQKIKNWDERIWYIFQIIENGWSRNLLDINISSNLYGRQKSAKKFTNFKNTLPALQSDLAEQTLKDPYIFDFITLTDKYNEKNLEDQICSHMTKFLLELGQGFAFMGRQVPIIVGEKKYFIDLLFYHLKLRCYIVVELKVADFEPEHVGKLSFYISAVNKTLKKEEDKPTIGLLLCKSKEDVVVEYVLDGLNQPVGVADFKLSKAIPDNLKSDLPSVEELERELEEI